MASCSRVQPFSLGRDVDKTRESSGNRAYNFFRVHVPIYCYHEVKNTWVFESLRGSEAWPVMTLWSKISPFTDPEAIAVSFQLNVRQDTMSLWSYHQKNKTHSSHMHWHAKNNRARLLNGDAWRIWPTQFVRALLLLFTFGQSRHFVPHLTSIHVTGRIGRQWRSFRHHRGRCKRRTCWFTCILCWDAGPFTALYSFRAARTTSRWSSCRH